MAPLLATGLWGVARVLNLTRDRFHVTLVGLGGLLPLTIAITSTWALAETSPSRAFGYPNLNDQVGISPEASLFFTFLAGLFLAGLMYGALAVYCQGIASDGSGHYDKRPDEPDAIGAVIKEMAQERKASR